MQQRKPSIKSWASDDRPREKLLNKGSQSLTNSELLAVLIRTGSNQVSAVDLAKEVLNGVENDLSELSRLSAKDLMRHKGIGEAKAIAIVSALELGRRRKEEGVKLRKKVVSSSDAYEILAPALEDIKHEEFWILLLNRANTIIGKYNVSKGGVSGTVADAKIIFKLSLDNLASSVILCHNHPSGNLSPSISDKQLTTKLKQAGETLDINVLDHLIVANSGYFSFADEGLI